MNRGKIISALRLLFRVLYVAPRLLALRFLFRLEAKCDEQKKILKFFLLALRMSPSSPIGAVKAHRFAYKLRVH
jgi:hypothetical protein